MANTYKERNECLAIHEEVLLYKRRMPDAN